MIASKVSKLHIKAFRVKSCHRNTRAGNTPGDSESMALLSMAASTLFKHHTLSFPANGTHICNRASLTRNIFDDYIEPS